MSALFLNTINTSLRLFRATLTGSPRPVFALVKPSPHSGDYWDLGTPVAVWVVGKSISLHSLPYWQADALSILP